MIKTIVVKTDIKNRGYFVDKPEAVNHPDHYNQYIGFEVIDVCEQLRGPDGTGNFNRGNAFKYLARAGWKNPENEVEDLKKAIFYLQREVDRIESNNWLDRDTQASSETNSIGFAKHPVCPVCKTGLIDAAPVYGKLERACRYSCGVLIQIRTTTDQIRIASRWFNMSESRSCPACSKRLFPALGNSNPAYYVCEEDGRFKLHPNHNDTLVYAPVNND